MNKTVCVCVMSTALASENQHKGSNAQDSSGGQRMDEDRPLVEVSALSVIQCLDTICLEQSTTTSPKR